MNILYTTAYDRDGQQFNGYLLHKELLNLGHKSQFAVFEKYLHDPEIHEIGGHSLRGMNNCLAYAERRLSLHSVLPILSFVLMAAPYYREAELIHLELLHARQFFSLLAIPLMTRRRPVIWTIHDPWLMSGHCVHSMDCERWLTGCGDCPDLGISLPIRSDRTALNWKIKKWVMHHARLSLVVASPWMYDRVKRSPILSHLPCHLIPFGVDTTIFNSDNKAANRRHFGIPKEDFVIAFRSVPWAGNFKGTEYVEKALLALKPSRKAHLLTFQDVGGLEALRGKFPFTELDWVTDRHLLAQALGAADVFLMPSTAEAFGMMAVESMACGTPVIAFEGTSLPGVIHAPRGGIAVPYGDHLALARAIEMLMRDQPALISLSIEATKIVKEEYTLELYLKRHLDLYQNLLGQSNQAMQPSNIVMQRS